VNEGNSQRSSERGAVLVMLAVIGSVLIFLIAMALVLGSVMTARTRHQDIANLVALAALNGYSEAPVTTNHQQKIIAGLAKANQILDSNTIPGYNGSLEHIVAAGSGTAGTGGEVQFGTYYPRILGANTNPCHAPDTPPCFVESDRNSTTATASAVRLALRTDRAEDFSPAWGNMVGLTAFDLTSYAQASIVQRCVEFVVDTSLSTFSQSHRPPYTFQSYLDPSNPAVHLGPPGPTQWVSDPIPSTQGFFAYRASSIGTPPRNCADRSNFLSGSPYSNYEFFSWCNLQDTRPANVSGPSDVRYKSDYSLKNTPLGLVYVDTFADSPPEPFTSYYQAFNSALQELRKNANPIDMAGMIVFAGVVRDRIPISTDYGSLLQLTNITNIGQTGYCPGGYSTCIPGYTSGTNGQTPFVSTEISPNFLSRGHFSLSEDPNGGTNLVLAFMEAINELRTCPQTAKKVIVLATDAKASCNYDARQSSNYFCGSGRPPITISEEQISGNPDPSWISGTGGNYSGGAWALMANWPFHDSGGAYRNVVEQLVADKISVTTIMAGEHVGMNFRNVWDPASGSYLSYEQAAAKGWHGRNRFWMYNHAPHFPSDQYQYFVNPSNNYWYPPAPPIWDPEWKDNICGHAMHEPNAAVYGSFNYGTSWWCDFNTYSSYFAGKIPGATDRRPLSMMTEVSMRTGGFMCPLMPKCNELAGKNNDANVWYECPVGDPNNLACPVTRRLKDSARNPAGNEWGDGNHTGLWQNCSVLEQSSREQARTCTLNTIGQAPYMLVEAAPF
jgi:hypothetical protein